jgi:hypothetical protein
MDVKASFKKDYIAKMNLDTQYPIDPEGEEIYCLSGLVHLMPDKPILTLPFSDKNNPKVVDSKVQVKIFVNNLNSFHFGMYFKKDMTPFDDIVLLDQRTGDKIREVSPLCKFKLLGDDAVYTEFLQKIVKPSTLKFVDSICFTATMERLKKYHDKEFLSMFIRNSSWDNKYRDKEKWKHPDETF